MVVNAVYVFSLIQCFAAYARRASMKTQPQSMGTAQSSVWLVTQESVLGGGMPIDAREAAWAA